MMHTEIRYILFLIRNVHQRKEILVGWSCPTSGSVKLNTDGAANGNRGAAGRG